MEYQELQRNLVSLGKLFEDYRKIHLDKIKLGYPKELKHRVIFLINSGADKNAIIKTTKISPPTLSVWLSQSRIDDISLPAPKELKISEYQTEFNNKTVLFEKSPDKYCAKINVNNGISIELTEQGLLLSINTLWGRV